MSRWIVVGAGIAGLAAAWEIDRRGDEVVVVEAGHRPGGFLQTFREGGFTVEAAAESIRMTPTVQKIVGSVGLSGALIPAGPAASKRFVAQAGGLLPLVPPPGFAPPARLAAATSGESVTDHFRRVLGPASVDFADALVTGVFAGDPARLEAIHALASVIPAPGTVPAPPQALRGGMASLVDALAAGLEVRIQTPTTSISRSSGFNIRSGDSSEHGDRVVVALGPAGLRLLDRDAPLVHEAPVSVLGIGLRAEDVADCEPARGYGLLCPASEGRFSLGILFSSSVFPHLAPDGKCLWRAFVGGRRHPERASFSKEETLKGVMGDVKTLLGIEPATDWVTLLRHGRGIPQPELGHSRVVEARARLEKENPGLAFCGLGFEGVALDQALESGIEAVVRVAGSR